MNPKKREIEEVLAHIEAECEDAERRSIEPDAELPAEFADLLRAQYMRRANWGAPFRAFDNHAVRRLMDQRNVARLEAEAIRKWGEARAAWATRWRWIALVELALLIASGIVWGLR